jgi:hypothetical protein
MFTFSLPGFLDNGHKHFQGLTGWHEKKNQTKHQNLSVYFSTEFHKIRQRKYRQDKALLVSKIFNGEASKQLLKIERTRL